MFISSQEIKSKAKCYFIFFQNSFPYVIDEEDEAGPPGDDDEDDEEDEDDEGDEEEDGSEGDEVGLSYLMKEGIQVSVAQLTGPRVDCVPSVGGPPVTSVCFCRTRRMMETTWRRMKTRRTQVRGFHPVTRGKRRSKMMVNTRF